MLKSISVTVHNLRNIGVLALVLAFTGCSSPRQTATQASNPTSATSAQASKPRVVATTSVLCDLTQEIARDTVELTCLMPGGTDPHLYQPKPSDRKAIETANLILYAGYGFEPDLIKLIQSTQNKAPKIAVSELAVPKPLKDEHHEDEHGDEHNHGELDPHVWENAQNGARMVEVVRDNLKQVAPSNAAQYANNSDKLTGELMQMHSWIKSQISTIPANQRKLVTTHDAMGYYAAAYGITVEGALQGISTDERPTAARVKELVQEIKAANVPTIFAEATINRKLIEAVAKETNVKVSNQVLFADSLGAKGTEGDTYKKMLIANTQAIVEGLGGNYTPFQPK